MNQILILTAGNVGKLASFNGVAKASFTDINYVLDDTGDYVLRCGEHDLANYKVIYFRLVGKNLEVATLVSNYAKEKGIAVVDKLYEDTHLLPASLAKSIELVKLARNGILIPKTVFGDFSRLPFPFVVKSTTGQKAREVWLVKDKVELDTLFARLDMKKNYFGQEFIPNATRIRVLVVGDKVVGGVVRQTKWNKTEIRETLNPVPPVIVEIALNSSRAMGLDICGVDILTNETGRFWVIEANAAPSWTLIGRNCKINVEDEIIKYLQTKV